MTRRSSSYGSQERVYPTRKTRTVVPGGRRHWHFDRVRGVWVSTGHPRFVIKPIVRRGEGIVWKVSLDGGEIFFDYASAIMGVEGITATHYRTKKRPTR